MLNRMDSPRRRRIHQMITSMATFVLLLVPLFIYLLMLPDATSRSRTYFLFVLLATFCSSLRWWPSFFHTANGESVNHPSEAQPSDDVLTQSTIETVKRRLHACMSRNRLKWYLHNAIRDMEKCRYRLYLYISIVQVIIYVALCHLLLPSLLRSNLAMYKEAFGQIHSIFYKYGWVLLSIVGTFLVFWAGRTMCKVTLSSLFHLFSHSLLFFRSPCNCFHFLCLWQQAHLQYACSCTFVN